MLKYKKKQREKIKIFSVMQIDKCFKKIEMIRSYIDFRKKLAILKKTIKFIKKNINLKKIKIHLKKRLDSLSHK